MIRQTPFGRFLCWLGIHQTVSGTIYRNPDEPWNISLVGGCVRCNNGFQWDV
jgi:hypothetical protein